MRSKRILSLVLALVMVLGTFGTVFAAPTDNVKVDWLIEEGLVLGYGDGTYGLDKAITRAEVTTMVVRALDLEDIAKASAGFASPYTDMNTPAVAWVRGYVTVATGQGVVEGYPNGEFRPSNQITYAEIAAMMVRVLGGLTPAEEANAVWPTTYLAKAVQLGVFDGVNGIADYNAPAMREKVFEMVYNAIINKQLGNYTIVKAIVLENNRVERLAKDEIVVEVIREVQRANQLDATIYERGDQEKLVIDAKVGDVENLLGHVADFTLDKNGRVIAIKADETYKIEIVQAEATKNKFGKYTVEIGERYKGTDERIYRTYLNNKAYAYEDFYKLDENDEFEVEYARATVKNGKVLFIDAFNFDDVMPVKELKDIRDKATIIAYDDVREGNTIELTASDKQVILVKDNKLSKGTLEDVKLDNVIHAFTADGKTEYIVLQDLAIEGKLDRITEVRNGASVVVDGKAYAIPTVSPKKAVYEFKSNDKFYTLEWNTAYRELDTFRGEEVRVLLGLDGNLQYIGSKVEFGDFVGVETRIVGREMRVLGPDNKLNDYTANLDTKVDALGLNGVSTGHQNLNEIKRNQLVYVNTVDKDLVEVIELMDPIYVTELDSRNIKLATDVTETTSKGTNYNVRNAFRLSDDTTIYVINVNGVAEVRTRAEVAAAYKKLEDDDDNALGNVKASLLSESRYDYISIRGDKFARDDNAFAVAIYNLEIKPKVEDSVYGKLLRFYDRKAGKSEIVVELSNGRQATFTLSSSLEDKNYKVGSFYEIEESTETEGLAVYVKPVTFLNGRIDELNGTFYDIDGDIVYEVRDTEFFGKKPIKGDRISYVKKNNDLLLVVNPSVEPEVLETGIVTYINPSATRLELDGGAPYKLNENTVLFDNNGNTIAIGSEDISDKLFEGDKVKGIKVNRDGFVTELTLIQILSETNQEAADRVDELIAALPVAADVVVGDKAAIEAVRAEYDKLTPAQKALVTKLNNLVNRENALAEEIYQALVTEAVDTAAALLNAGKTALAAGVTQADIDAAEVIVAKVGADPLYGAMDDEEALNDVMAAQGYLEDKVVIEVNIAALSTKYEVRTAVNNNLKTLGIESAITLEAADYLKTKLPSAGYPSALAIRSALADFAAL